MTVMPDTPAPLAVQVLTALDRAHARKRSPSEPWSSERKTLFTEVMAAVGPELDARDAQLEHAKAALAGDSEGMRLWMLDCATLVEKNRDRAKEAEARLAAIRELADQMGDRSNEPRDWQDKDARPSDRRLVEPIKRMLLAILDGTGGAQAAPGGAESGQEAPNASASVSEGAEHGSGDPAGAEAAP